MFSLPLGEFAGALQKDLISFYDLNSSNCAGPDNREDTEDKFLSGNSSLSRDGDTRDRFVSIIPQSLFRVKVLDFDWDYFQKYS